MEGQETGLTPKTFREFLTADDYVSTFVVFYNIEHKFHLNPR